jgi:hypothetical protein
MFATADPSSEQIGWDILKGVAECTREMFEDQDQDQSTGAGPTGSGADADTDTGEENDGRSLRYQGHGN